MDLTNLEVRKNEIEGKIEDLNNKIEDLNNEINEYYDMDSFDEICEGMSASEVARKCFYGDFRPCDDYFKFNGYENFESVESYVIEDLKEEKENYEEEIEELEEELQKIEEEIENLEEE